MSCYIRFYIRYYIYYYFYYFNYFFEVLCFNTYNLSFILFLSGYAMGKIITIYESISFDIDNKLQKKIKIFYLLNKNKEILKKDVEKVILKKMKD